ncbi:MAG: EAL domain-containing protein [Candidatus Dormibacteraeota bacterium]|nr:EAL domain-containing protein [Candidatus Dormibacteraeota bacterium]
MDLQCIAGVDGYFKLLNPAWEATLGWTTGELLAHPLIDFVHPDDRDASLAERARVATGGQVAHFRNRYRCRDGSYRWLDWTASPASPYGLVYASARDVTALVAAEQVQREALRIRRERIRHAIDGGARASLTIVWQPIVYLRHHEVRGVEALSRFHAPPNRSPDLWFEEAASVGLRTELELRAVRDALSCLDVIPVDQFLSLNVSPTTLVSDGFAATLSSIDGSRLIIEVTEHAAVDDYEQLTDVLRDLRTLGLRLAIDDAGAGFASFSHIVRLRPDFIKLDRFLTQNVEEDPVKRSLASALNRFAADIGAPLIAEGVETPAQLRVMESLGVDYAQGYLLGRPQPLQTSTRAA